MPIHVNSLEELGRIIQKRRKSLKITQQELSSLCNLSVVGISKIERGKSDLRFSTLKRLGDILGIQVVLELEE